MLPLRTTPFFVSLTALAAAANAANVEYLPGVRWREPVVVDPGATFEAPPSDAIVLFDGTDLSRWENGENWLVKDGVAYAGNGNVTTKQSFGDLQLHLEWSAPPVTGGAAQGRGNSGVYLMGLYEVQILDSYQNETYPDGQAGAVYKQSPPMANAMRGPGAWNTYDIFWTCPRFDSGRLVSPAYVTVVHNGVLVLNHFAVRGDTTWHRPPIYVDHGPTGPIVLQDHGDPVRFRNIWVRELAPPPSEGSEPPSFIDHASGETWPMSEGTNAPRNPAP